MWLFPLGSCHENWLSEVVADNLDGVHGLVQLLPVQEHASGCLDANMRRILKATLPPQPFLGWSRWKVGYTDLRTSSNLDLDPTVFPLYASPNKIALRMP